MLSHGKLWSSRSEGALRSILSSTCRLLGIACSKRRPFLKASATARSWHGSYSATSAFSQQRQPSLRRSVNDQCKTPILMASIDEAGVEPDYGFQEDVESFRGYVPGGYHPVLLGDELASGRYKVAHKLGYGASSTVWLARDQVEERYVAIKITVADRQATQEKSILHHLRDAVHKTPLHAGGNHISWLLDEFTLDGPNGRHTCLVSEPAVCTIADSKEAGRKWMFPLATARSIVAQLFHAVALCTKMILSTPVSENLS